jgi:cytochrome c553
LPEARKPDSRPPFRLLFFFEWIVMSKLAQFFLLALLPLSVHAADAAAGKAKSQTCMACHGANGISTVPTIPSLAAQQPLFILYQLIQYREKRRASPEMNAIASTLSDTDMRDLAAYYAALPPPAPVTGLDPAKLETGRLLSERNHCQSCHMADLRGQKHVPRLAGQHVDYTKSQLLGLRNGTRADIDGNMASAAQGLTDADIEALSQFSAAFTSP